MIDAMTTCDQYDCESLSNSRVQDRSLTFSHGTAIYSAAGNLGDNHVADSRLAWYWLRMKRDGRGFDHQTLEAIRLMAIERVREGEAPSAVIASYGFARTTIY